MYVTLIPGRPVGLMEKSTRYDLSSSVDNSTSMIPITPIPFLETSVAFLSWERESIVGPQSSKELGRIQLIPAYVIHLPLSAVTTCYIRPKTQDKTLDNRGSKRTRCTYNCEGVASTRPVYWMSHFRQTRLTLRSEMHKVCSSFELVELWCTCIDLHTIIAFFNKYKRKDLIDAWLGG